MDEKTSTAQSPGAQKARRRHRASIVILAVVTAAFLLGVMVFDASLLLERLLYGTLTAAALFFMFATMSAMIHKSE